METRMKNTKLPMQLPTIRPSRLVRIEFDVSHLSPEPENGKEKFNLSGESLHPRRLGGNLNNADICR